MPLTVLVVDDDPDFRRVVVRLLRLRGIEVVADVADGESALVAVRRYRPGGVLIDINLPDHNGICVARRLTTHPDAPTVVLTSTDSSGYTAEDLAACGVRAFVLKDELPRADLLGLFSPSDT